jgi:two-component system, OmpR family, phosphate regulon sensor histidine kinase PhoR
MLTNKMLRIIALLSVISLTGLVLIQLYWVQKSHKLTSRQFGDRVTLALMGVAGQINKFHNDSTSTTEPVERLNDASFLVNTFGTVSGSYLQNLLQVEFGKYGIEQAYSFAVYDCFLDSVQWFSYGNINQEFPEASGNVARPPEMSLEMLSGDNHVILVYFPKWNSFILREMGLMAMTTFGILVVMAIFSFLVILIFRQKRLNEIREDFINNMTHEFKTPIATMTVAGEALAKPKVIENPERIVRYAKIIQEESRRLKAQVENILRVAVLDADSMKLDKSPIHLHNQLNTICDTFKVRVQETGGSLTLNAQADRDLILGDTDHLANVWYNLLDNALKYGGKPPVILLTTKRKGNTIEVRIQDNGQGIPLRAQKHIFEKFYRVPTGNVHNVKGFGLGLSYVQKIVKKHRGDIRLEESNQKGSIFILKLPLES